MPFCRATSTVTSHASPAACWPALSAESPVDSPSPTANAAPSIPVPEPVEMMYPPLNASRRANRELFRQFVTAQSVDFDQSITDCAWCVAGAVLKDIETGALPDPTANPMAVEDALYARAALQARHSDFLVRDSVEPLFVLLFAGVRKQRAGTAFSDLSDGVLVSVARHASDRPPAVLLHTDQLHPCRELGLRARLDWFGLAVRVFTDAVLTRIAEDSEYRIRLRLNRSLVGEERRGAVWVGEKPHVPEELATTSHRKRRKA